MVKPLKGFAFLFRAIRLRLILAPIDKKSPFAGEMAEFGWTSIKLSDSCIKQLKSIYERSNKNILFLEQDKACLSEISEIVTPIVKSYIGPECYIDGMTWLVTTEELARTRGASNWHTDNVGNRIRLFICIEGNGSQPTLVIPSSDRIPTTMTWILQTLKETIRWFGFPNKVEFHNEQKLDHQTGKAYLWDSQLFHRGGYETGIGDRILLSVEFSNPAKHQLAKGPIGTKPNLRFSFPNNFFEITSFQKILDADRMVDKDQRVEYTDLKQ